MTLIIFLPFILIIIGIIKNTNRDTSKRNSGKVFILAGCIILGVALLIGISILAVCSSR